MFPSDLKTVPSESADALDRRELDGSDDDDGDGWFNSDDDDSEKIGDGDAKSLKWRLVQN